MFDRDLPRPTADVAGRSPTIGGELINNNPSRDAIDPSSPGQALPALPFRWQVSALHFGRQLFPNSRYYLIGLQYTRKNKNRRQRMKSLFALSVFPKRPRQQRLKQMLRLTQCFALLGVQAFVFVHYFDEFLLQ